MNMRFPGGPPRRLEDAPAGAHVIAGVPTSTAAFVGATQAGPVAAPLIVHSFAEFEAQFGAAAWQTL